MENYGVMVVYNLMFLPNDYLKILMFVLQLLFNVILMLLHFIIIHEEVQIVLLNIGEQVDFVEAFFHHFSNVF